MSQVIEHRRRGRWVRDRLFSLLFFGTVLLFRTATFEVCHAETIDPPSPSPADSRGEEFFQQEIAALLRARCVKCHGPGKKEAELDLSSAGGITRGSASGPVVMAHDLNGSLLWTKIAESEMPPDDPLVPDERERIREWITQGAAGLANAEAKRSGPEDHWAFRPLVRPELPRAEKRELLANPIDAFIEKRLEDVGLQLAPRASREQLVRRVSLMLTGLPPTLIEFQRFVSDDSSSTYSEMVEYYLASPHYGERWGKYWLDAVGYADSNGYFNADTDRPFAYRYRDYVIHSLNEDRPFDQFLREQLAGDELAQWKPGESATPSQIDQLVATHFLRNGQDGSGESDGNPDELRVDRYTALESCQQTVTSALLGLTGQCAKCHDHKFEPITQADYYRLQAILYPTFPAAHGELWQKPQRRIVHAPLPAEQQAWEADLAEATRKANDAAQSVQQFIRNERATSELLFVDDVASQHLEGELILERRRTSTRSPFEQAGGWREQLKQLRDAQEAAEAQQEQIESQRPGAMAWASAVSAQVPATRRLVRGNYNEPAEEMQPALFAFLTTHSTSADDATNSALRQVANDSTTSTPEGSAASPVSTDLKPYDRLQLARDLTTPETRATSLMARVQINRIWQSYFGTGIVATPENLGLSGAVPTHPELLDWMAHEWIRAGWKLKQVHRWILHSATFQQSSDVVASERVRDLDAANRLLWRYPLLRLDADALRDSMLSVSETLDRSMDGSYIPTQRDQAGEVLVPETQRGARRRSIYLQQRRTQVVSLLQVFDSPSIVFNAPRRPRTTMPLQSLSLLNGSFTRQRATQWADRLLQEDAHSSETEFVTNEKNVSGASSDDRRDRWRVERIYQAAFSRRPSEEEVRSALGFLQEQVAQYDIPVLRARRQAWIDVCHGILMSNEFLYVD